MKGVISMKSIVNTQGEAIDSRYLRIYGTFYSVSKEEATALALAYYTFFSSILKESFVIEWKNENGHLLKNIQDMITTKKSLVYNFALEGYVKSNIVNNKKTLNEYNKMIYRNSNNIIVPDTYTPYYHKNIQSNIGDHEALKEAVLRLFDEEGQIPLTNNKLYDVQGGFSNAYMTGTSGLYYGEFCFMIRLFCIEDSVNRWSDLFADFGRKMMRFDNINICIDIDSGLPGISDPYSLHYGRDSISCDNSSLVFSDMRIYLRYFYITEICWGHFISSETAKLGLNLMQKSDSDIVEFEQTENSGIYIHLKTSIDKSTIHDLKQMKKIIYSCVLPRFGTHPLHHISTVDEARLRRDWEVVPVFRDELYVSDSYNFIRFTHFGKIKFETVCSSMQIDPDEMHLYL